MQPTSHSPGLDDDRPVGRVLTRREALAVLAASGAAIAVAASGARVLAQVGPSPAAGALSPDATLITIPSCVVSPELTEGPYFVDARLDRSDIRSDPTTGAISEGLPLALSFLVTRLDGSSCVPFEGAVVDVWHCDAAGAYSGVRDANFDTSQMQFLRGLQRTDADGKATFTTIYPGWYSGRAVHIHFKIRSDPDAAQGLEFTSQLFFDDEVSRTVFTQEPYLAKGPQDTPNDADMIYPGAGELLLLDLVPTAEGYATTFPIGVMVS